MATIPHHFTSEAKGEFPLSVVHFYQPGGIAARDDLLRRHLEKAGVSDVTAALRIAAATRGVPGTYTIEYQGRVYSVRIRGQIKHEGNLYGILTSITRY